MATRPFAFGARYTENGRTVRVRTKQAGSRRYQVEVSRKGGRTRQREHTSLADAFRDFAQAWRDRLN